jgi:hypothetical protein
VAPAVLSIINGVFLPARTPAGSVFDFVLPLLVEIGGIEGTVGVIPIFWLTAVVLDV